MRAPKFGDLITPTGRLVMAAEQMRGDREEWLKLRSTRPGIPGGYSIGSSEVPSILDLDGVDTPAHVYRSKVLGVRPEPNEAMNWGHLLEDPIAREWCRRNRAVIDEIGLVSHKDFPWHGSTIDRRVRECPVYKGTPEGECLLEVKNVGFASASRWHADIPDRILAQIVHQLYVTGYGHAHYACLVGGNTMKQGIVWANREAELMAYIVGEVDRFRVEHLLARVEPAWDTSAKAAKLIELDQRSYPERVGTLDIEGVGEVMEYARLSAAEGAIKKEKEAAAARLRQLAAGAELVTFADRAAYRYGTSARTKVDLDALRERHPDAYADPEVVSTKDTHTLYIDKAYKIKGGK